MERTSSGTKTRGSGQEAGLDQTTDDQLQLVTFVVANEEFAVDILAVQEINRMMNLTRVPASPPAVEGVINLRGKIIPVIDLRKRFGMPTGEKTDRMRIVVVEVHGRVVGFIVDSVNEVLRISSNIVEPAPAMVSSVDTEFISGVGKLEDRLLILLDIQKLFDAGLVDSAEHAVALAA